MDDAAFKLLHDRADLLAQIRHYFSALHVLEVETPMLSLAASPSPHINLFKTGDDAELYLQSSPEFAMKKLLVRGSGSIYQVAKCFRNGEQGRHHNPEFTMLEWYRVDINYHQLMAEIEQLLKQVLDVSGTTAMSYQQTFQQYCDIENIHHSSVSELQQLIVRFEIHYSALDANHDASYDAKCSELLDVIFSHVIQPKLGHDQPVFIYDFPVPQAQYAQLRDEAGQSTVAERFELFIKGLEIANGYQELTDGAEQLQRFENEQDIRIAMGLPEVTLDQDLITALKQGLPRCSGVALGLDRLLMLCSGSESIDQVLALN